MNEERNPFDGPGGGGGDSGGDGGGWDFNEKDIKSLRIPAGPYDMRCIEAVDGHSRAGNRMITVTLVVLRGEHAGREFKTYITKNLASLWKVKDTIFALGVKPDAEGNWKFKPDDLLDKECVAHIVDDTYQDQDKSSIKRLVPPSGLGVSNRRTDLEPTKKQPEPTQLSTDTTGTEMPPITPGADEDIPF